MLRILRPWLAFIASAAVSATAVCVHTWHGASPPKEPPGGTEAVGSVLDGARLTAKTQVAENMIAGRLTLLEGAAAFKELDAGGAPYPPEAVTNCDSRSTDEGYCRMLISWVRERAPPDSADDLTHSLEAELDARLRDGTLRLPD